MAKYLGDYIIPKESFKGLDDCFKSFGKADFKKLAEQKKSDAVSRALFDLIEEGPAGFFLLIPILEFIELVNEKKIVEHYTFSTFEMWFNQSSGLNFEENYRVRGKMVGKYVPRDEYQIFFPLGMGKVYPGCHFVTAHGSPDLDTTVASFWGWMDAFAARVGESLHFWNVPDGEPAAQTEIAFLFHNVFGKNIFTQLAKNRTSLAVSSFDLMTQHGVVRKETSESTLGVVQEAVILVDSGGYYLGEWRNIDVERVRYVITLLNQCLRWYENNLHVKLIALFAKEHFARKDLTAFVKAMFGMTIEECEPAREFTEEQRKLVQNYLSWVLGVKKGLSSTIEEFARAMKSLSLFDFQEFASLLESLEKSSLFDSSGKLRDNRPQLFHHLAKIIQGLDKAIYSIRLYVEKLDVALKVKTSVLGIMPQHVSYRADLEEVRSKMDGYPYLTVTAPDKEGKLFPLGVVHASDLYRTVLGTVSLRDFCNREETKIPSYLEVISVIDHHKSALNTLSPPVAFITDSQSSNTLVAELSFAINDKYSTGGMTRQEIDNQMKEIQGKLDSPSKKRIFQRLLQKHMVVEHKSHFSVSVQREIVECFHFLYAILEDTDLLTKISPRDIECVASLLNRLKSLISKKEMEIIHFDDIKRDANFKINAAKRILQNEEMYSLYRKIYASKEESVEENLKLCVKGKPSTFFSDTKEQNGCCRVGQAKLFSKNFPVFEKHAMGIRKLWLESAQAAYKERKEIDFHLQMVSTIAGAEELYSGTEGRYQHKDEIWLWIPSTESAIEHLKTFLNNFKSSPPVVKNQFEVEFLGDNAMELDQIFTESFLPIPHKTSKQNLNLAVLRFKAGTINSRKAMISPYLPRIS